MQYLLVDAFTLPGEPFTGNPAAVVLLDEQKSWPSDSWLQGLAMEFNQSETAYVRRLPHRSERAYELRWFTPRIEVPLCGHATLASAHALRTWDLLRTTQEGAQVSFVTRKSGELKCTYPAPDQVSMDFPAVPTAPASLPPDAAKVLGVEGPVGVVGAGGTGLLLRLPAAAQVLDAKPDLKTLATWHAHAVFITAPGGAPDLKVDFVSRFFAPAVGIDEDPVTGSAHCTLAVYWGRELHQSAFTALQLSRRKGFLNVRLNGDRVQLQGRAVVTASGRVTA